MNYNSMPGHGNLPGLYPSGNNPATPDPVYGRTDAAADVAERLARNGDCAELVEALAESRALFDWISHNVELPAYLLETFRTLDKHCRDLDRHVADVLAELTGGVDP